MSNVRKKILIIGRHQDLMQKILLLLKKNGYEADGTSSNDEAVALFPQKKYDAVIIGGGVDNESKYYFETAFKKINPDIIIIHAHPTTILDELSKI